MIISQKYDFLTHSLNNRCLYSLPKKTCLDTLLQKISWYSAKKGLDTLLKMGCSVTLWKKWCLDTLPKCGCPNTLPKNGLFWYLAKNGCLDTIPKKDVFIRCLKRCYDTLPKNEGHDTQPNKKIYSYTAKKEFPNVWCLDNLLWKKEAWRLCQKRDILYST